MLSLQRTCTFAIEWPLRGGGNGEAPQTHGVRLTPPCRPFRRGDKKQSRSSRVCEPHGPDLAGLPCLAAAWVGPSGHDGPQSAYPCGFQGCVLRSPCDARGREDERHRVDRGWSYFVCRRQVQRQAGLGQAEPGCPDHDVAIRRIASPAPMPRRLRHRLEPILAFVRRAASASRCPVGAGSRAQRERGLRFVSNDPVTKSGTLRRRAEVRHHDEGKSAPSLHREMTDVAADCRGCQPLSQGRARLDSPAIWG